MAKSDVWENLFYFRLILHIGGTEQFLYEIAKKYHGKDITVLYDRCDPEQYLRLRKLVRCVKREPSKIYRAKRAFFNFNDDAFDQVEAEKKYFVSHANWDIIQYKPPVVGHNFDGYIGVSKFSQKKMNDYLSYVGRDRTCQMSYNPLVLEDVKPPVRIISAGRIEDKTKGGERTLKLIDALDEASARLGLTYEWDIFTGSMPKPVMSQNVNIKKGRLDIRSFIAGADWLVQLSEDMETYCYSLNEALGLGTKIVRTPLTVCKEFSIPDGAELVLDWDCGNIKDVAEKILQNVGKNPAGYIPPEDDWDKWLGSKKATYTPTDTIRVQARCRYFDIQLEKNIKPSDGIFEVTLDRGVELVQKQVCDFAEDGV